MKNGQRRGREKRGGGRPGEEQEREGGWKDKGEMEGRKGVILREREK